MTPRLKKWSRRGEKVYAYTDTGLSIVGVDPRAGGGRPILSGVGALSAEVKGDGGLCLFARSMHRGASMSSTWPACT